MEISLQLLSRSGMTQVVWGMEVIKLSMLMMPIIIVF